MADGATLESQIEELLDQETFDPPEAFAENYERWSADMTDDVPFYVELAKEADGPVVELAVGTGRVAIPVSQVRILEEPRVNPVRTAGLTALLVGAAVAVVAIFFTHTVVD